MNNLGSTVLPGVIIVASLVAIAGGNLVFAQQAASNATASNSTAGSNATSSNTNSTAATSPQCGEIAGQASQCPAQPAQTYGIAMVAALIAIAIGLGVGVKPGVRHEPDIR